MIGYRSHNKKTRITAHGEAAARRFFHINSTIFSRNDYVAEGR